MGSQVEIDRSITPLQQELVQQYGLVAAAVLARVQVYCRMSDGVCTASLITVGKDLDLDKGTVYRHVQAWCERGYLVDETPDLRNHPHTYRDTGKAGIVVSISGSSGVVVDNTSVAQNNTSKNKPQNGVAQNNTSVAESNTKRAGVAQNNTKGPGVAENIMTTVVVVNPLNTIKMTQQQQAAKTELIRAGVGKRKAEALARCIDPARIDLALDVYAFQRQRNKARDIGWLLDFLEEEWSPPADYIPPEERCEICGQSVHNHARDCRARYLNSQYACPTCGCSPCTCELEEVEEIDTR